MATVIHRKARRENDIVNAAIPPEIGHWHRAVASDLYRGQGRAGPL